MRFCERHQNKKRIVHCFECQSTFCGTCYLTEHKNHTCSYLNREIEELEIKVTKRSSEIVESSIEVIKQLNRWQTVREDLVDKLKKKEELLTPSECISLAEVTSWFSEEINKKMGELDLMKRELLLQKRRFDSFIKYSKTARTSAIPQHHIPIVFTALIRISRDLADLRIVNLDKKKRLRVERVHFIRDEPEYGSKLPGKFFITGNLFCELNSVACYICYSVISNSELQVYYMIMNI